MVFYRKYRPQKFSDLVGQEEIAKTILAQLESGKVGQGYLFWGPRGTGKTSTARILAKAVNCEAYGKQETANKKQETKFGEPCDKCDNCLAIGNGSFIDLIEIDAASNRGIDEVRDLRDKVKLSPAIGRFKVYIIDEVHMLTPEAFNALLKTLEEPPKHVIFILATTDYSKLPATVVSRLMKFNFRRATKEGISTAVARVAKEEKIKIKPDAIDAIVEVSEGSFRDAISFLDQISAIEGEINKEDVLSLARTGSWDRVIEFIDLTASGNVKEAVLFVDELPVLGLDTVLFVRQAVTLLEKLLHIKIGVDANDIELQGMDTEAVLALSGKFSFGELQKLIRLLVVCEGEMKAYPLPQIPVVLAVCKYCEDKVDVKEESNGQEKSEKNADADNRSEMMPAKKEEEKKTVPLVSEKKISKKEKGDTSFEEVEKNWKEFLNRVRVANAHVFALLRATRPASYDGEVVTLEVFYRFHKDKLEEPKILKLLDVKFEEIMGSKMRLKFVLAKKESLPTAAVERSDVVDSRSNDLEKIAQEIFSK